MQSARFFWQHCRYHPILLFFYVFFSSWVGLHGLFNSYLTKRLIDTLPTLQNNQHLLIFLSIFFILNFEMHNLCWRGIHLINKKLIPSVKTRISCTLFKQVHSQTHKFFERHLSGTISNHIHILTETMEKALSNICVRLIRGVVQFLGSLIFLSFIHPLFSLAFLSWAICFTAFNFLFSKKIQSLSRDLAMAQSMITGKIVDSLSNSTAIRLFSRQKEELSHLTSSLNQFEKVFKKKERFLIKFYFIQGFSITCLIACIVYLLIHLWAKGVLTIGDFAFILAVSLYLTDTVWSNTELIDQLSDALGRSSLSLKTLTDTEKTSSKKIKQQLKCEKGVIEFRNISFHYHPNAPLFVNQSLLIPAGQKVGIVGPSGAGKSTFIKLLLQLYPVQKGSILIDNQNIFQVTSESLYSAIGVVPQEPSLFHRSVIENILFGNPYAKESQLMRTLKQASVDTFASSLQDGYHSLIGEKGIKLSGGEKQRIAFARVILKNAPILIMDEPTSQLDTLSEHALQKALKELLQNKTALIIAHRLSTLRLMDRILVFNKGRIVQDGSHQELLTKDGLYKDLWRTQTDGLI